jgi:hypothetical protein
MVTMSATAQTTSGYNVSNSTNYQWLQCQQQHKLPVVTMSATAQTTTGYNVSNSTNYQWLHVNNSRTKESVLCSRGHWSTQILLYPTAHCLSQIILCGGFAFYSRPRSVMGSYFHETSPNNRVLDVDSVCQCSDLCVK